MNGDLRKKAAWQAKFQSFAAVKKNWYALVSALLVAEFVLLCGSALVAGAIIAKQPDGATFLSPLLRGISSAYQITPEAEIAEPQTPQPQNPAASSGGAAEVPTILAPQPANRCGEPSLIFAAANFTIHPLASASALIPDGAEGLVFRYHAEDLVFVFAPTPTSLDLVRSVRPGDLMTISEADCSGITFALSAPGPGGDFDPAQDGAPVDELVLLFQQPGGAEGLIVRGLPLPEESIATGAPPAAGEIEAEISLIETIPSADGSALQVRVGVRNYGTGSFVLRQDDVRLIAGDGAQAAPQNAQPALPRTFAPGTSEEFVFTFPRPTIPEPFLQIFTAEVLIEGY